MVYSTLPTVKSAVPGTSSVPAARSSVATNAAAIRATKRRWGTLAPGPDAFRAVSAGTVRVFLDLEIPSAILSSIRKDSLPFKLS